jgi:dTDP-4-amino-4,6-dideoxygalactose transaminase
LPAKTPPIPTLDLARQYESIRLDILAAIERVCASTHYILGEEVAALEHELAAYTGAAAAVGCASGTDALWLALLATGIQPGDPVITTPFSFFASASAIVRAGARPVFADIDPRTFNLDPARLAANLRDGQHQRVRALLPVHLYGQCADMSALAQLAEEFKLTVIEDAAQAIGAAWKDKRAGAIGHAAAFSFYPTKNLSAYGDAGCITTNDQEFAEHLRRLRNHGSPRRYVHEEFGWNSRLDAIQAAILRVKLPHIENWNEQRRQRAATYDQLFLAAGLGAASLGTTATPVTLPWREPNAHHVFHQYVIRAQRRDALRQFLGDRHIGSEIYYPIPLHLQTCFAYLGYREGDLPEAERAAREVLALPMFPELTEEEQNRVVEVVAEFYT